MDVKSWKQQQAYRTREQLVETARRLFVEKGYANTPMEELCSRAGMTRGALYHHFRDKLALFDAVVQREVDKLGDRVALLSKQQAARQSKHKRHPARYLAALEIRLDELADPATRRLVLVEAPAVLGRERLDEWLHGHVFRVLKRVIRARSEEGSLPPRLVEPLSHLLIGAVQEAALVVGEADDPDKARRDLVDAFRMITAPFVGGDSA